MEEWMRFAWLADEWICAYAQIYGLGIISPRLSAIGHAVELYLKAVHIKQTNDVVRTLTFNHRIDALWMACKSNDSAFMPDVNLRESWFRINPSDAYALFEREPEQLGEYIEHQELYLLAWSPVNLKYLGTPFRPAEKEMRSYGYVHPNDYWIKFARSLRSYLGYPPKGGHASVLNWTVNDKSVPESARWWLSHIIADE